jgi:hypothetical protein
MVPDKVKAVLRDFRSGKASSASELAKLHGVSRSAVYRLLKKEAEVSPEQLSEVKAQTAEKQESSEENTDSGTLMEDLFSKAEQFANTLGLPEQGGKVLNEEPKDEQAEHEKEEKLDAFMSAIMGEAPQGLTLNLPPGLEEAISGDGPMTPRPRTSLRRIEPENELLQQRPQVTSEAKRAEITQRIVFNIQHFGPQLEVITGSNREAFLQGLSALSTPQLSETLTTLERTRSVGTISAGFKQVFYIAAQGVEVTSGLVGVKSNGFVAQLQQQDEEIGMCMKEIALNEWERLKNLDSPQVRLGMLFCLTLAQTHTRNEMLSYRDAPVNPELSKANEDL